MSDLRKAADPYIRPGTVVPVDIETTKILVDLLRQALAHQPEPIAWMVYSVDGQSVCITDDPTSFSDDQRALPLWPGPFEREWVGLTDEEKGWCAAPTYEETVNRTEAKLKEKNT